MCVAGECMFCRYRQIRIADVETRGTAQGAETEGWDAQRLPPERNMVEALPTGRQRDLSSC